MSDLTEVNRELAQSLRTTPPAAEEAHLWAEILDTAGGPTTWAPKELLDRFYSAHHRARYGAD